MSRGSFLGLNLLRVAGSVLAALVAGCFAAALDALFASRAQGLPFASLLVTCMGLILPLALLLGVLVGSALSVILPDQRRPELWAWVGATRADDRAAERALVLAMGPLAFVLWLFAVARWALLALAADVSPANAGVVVALGALALGSFLVLGGRALATRATTFGTWLPTPGKSLAVSLALSSSLLGIAVFSGAPSGAGSFFRMWGVLTRDELDLRPLGEALVIVASAAAFRAPTTWRGGIAALALAAASGVLTLRVSHHGLEAAGARLAIERSAPLASSLLPSLRRLYDRDRDGYAARFGGGDCDDARADVNPGADDVPANGIDEDCSGADANRIATPTPSAGPPPDKRARALARLPNALNVILLTVDTLRYDLGYAGNPRPLSPELDRLAGESVVFERAYSLASYTAKSLPPMLIGRYSSETHRGYSHFNRFEKSDIFVAERLQRAGVQTLSVQGHWYFFQNYGMERGFDRVDTSASPRAAQAAEGDRSVTSERVSDAVLAELSRPELAQKPFFLWAHYTDPHAEYVEHPGIDFGRGPRAAYDGEVAFVDREIGRVLAALRQSPLWSRTVVIVTSDHGEAFGEHGMIRHGFELWEELVRVPLLVRVPSVQARSVTARRSAIDLVPTILELMRVDTAPGSVSGRSLLPDLASLPGDGPPAARAVFIDMAEGPNNAERRALIEGDKKLVMSGGRPLGLYDLARDPEEKHDLSSDRAALGEALSRYRAFKSSLREVTVRPPR
jgi:choline-sulfatase